MRGGKACAVHAIVHRRIDACVELIDGGAQRLRVEVQVVAGHAVKCAVEHADDLRRFIADDALLLVVPQYGHRDATGVVAGIGGVALMHEVEVVELVAG
ncbi:hypothetical protein D3C80_1241530 [compost metagenome]